MSDKLPNCPRCNSNSEVRLYKERMTAVQYWCGKCRITFDIRKNLGKRK